MLIAFEVEMGRKNLLKFPPEFVSGIIKGSVFRFIFFFRGKVWDVVYGVIQHDLKTITEHPRNPSVDKNPIG